MSDKALLTSLCKRRVKRQDTRPPSRAFVKSLCLLHTEAGIVQTSLDVMKSENGEKGKTKSFTNAKVVSSNRIDHQLHNEKVKKVNLAGQIKQYEFKKDESTTTNAKSVSQKMEKIESYKSNSLKKSTRSSKIDQPLIISRYYLSEDKDAH